MPVKRRNHGRAKANRGHTHMTCCLNCGKMVPKDKIIKRFGIKNMVDSSSVKDVSDACVFEGYELPKIYQKQFYCISCAVHRRIVRPRSAVNRRNRIPLYLKLKMEKQEQKGHKMEKSE